jgi:uncharacterized metal-binding protein YceD (DUF177 family)
VSRPLFTVPLADVERNDVSLQWPIPPEWLDTQLADTEAKSQGRIGLLTATLAKNGREVLVQAQAKVDVVMPCARTLDPVPLTLEPQIYLLLAPRTGPVGGVARAKSAPTTKGSSAGSADKRHKQKRGNPRDNRASTDDSDDILSDDDAARDTFEGDHIVLDSFVREHIVLELPLFPLRPDLRSEDSSAIGPPAASQKAERAVDPRLAPLAVIASKLRAQKKE